MFKKTLFILCSLAFGSAANAGNSSDWASNLDSAFQPSQVVGFQNVGDSRYLGESSSEQLIVASQRSYSGWTLTASLKGHEQFGSQDDYHPCDSEKADFKAVKQDLEAFGFEGVDLRGFRIGARISF